ncbi:MAG: SDR family NAD(P)-dependent oxidoreductase [Janthinobacterium lividum]
MKDYHVFSSENLTDCPYKATGYQSSKTALNMYTINLAFDLRETNFKVNSVCPGFTSTDINNH